jgi:hypothetical protein
MTLAVAERVVFAVRFGTAMKSAGTVLRDIPATKHVARTTVRAGHLTATRMISASASASLSKRGDRTYTDHRDNRPVLFHVRLHKDLRHDASNGKQEAKADGRGVEQDFRRLSVAAARQRRPAAELHVHIRTLLCGFISIFELVRSDTAAANLRSNLGLAVDRGTRERAESAGHEIASSSADAAT